MSTASIRFGHWLYHNTMALEAQLYGFRKHQLSVGDSTLHFYSNGMLESRETLVLLHGFSADKSIWLRCARHFNPRYNVVIPDVAGHGDNDFDGALSHSIPAQANRVAELMERLNIQQAHVAGNSMGGFLSAYLARHYPDKVSTAVLLDPAGITTPLRSEFETLLEQGTNRFLIDSRHEFDLFYPMTMHKPPFIPAIVQSAVAQKYQDRRNQLEKIFTDYHYSDRLDNELSAISLPCLVIWGRHDRLIDVSGADVWRDGIPQCECVVFDELGHMPMVEDSGKTAKAMRSFFDNYI